MKKLNLFLLAGLLLLLATPSFAELNIVPRPVRVIENSGFFQLKNGQIIGFNDSQLQPAANYLHRILTRATGFNIKVRNGNGVIQLVLLHPGDNNDESYTLLSQTDKITITARSYRGIINGIASLRQMLPVEIEKHEVVKGVDWKVPAAEIQDAPQFNWRGLMLDPVRHFYTVEETERFLDQMALYKFNKFHWHLTDSQGWRIQIKKYPKLTEQGAWRHFLGSIDRGCFKRARTENNPTLNLPVKNMIINGTDTLYGGFYTQEQIREVVRFAAVRGIDVVPELDMPGHNTTATQCYPWLSCQNDGNDPLCIGKETTLEFAKNVYKEVFSLFPYEYVHIGGDEVNRNRWKDCKDCQQRIKNENLKDITELQAWFTKYMEKFFNSYNRKLMGWDEILEGGLSKTALVYWWRGDHTDVVQKSTEMGNEVVLCPTTFCYFDYGQDNNTIRRIYDGDIVPTDLSKDQLQLVKGIQANIWGEWIPSEGRMQFMVFPRALAMIEKAWTAKENQNWNNFENRLKAQLPRLTAAGINFRPLQTNQP